MVRNKEMLSSDSPCFMMDRMLRTLVSNGHGDVRKAMPKLQSVLRVLEV